MKKYSNVNDRSDTDISSLTRRDSDTVSVASSHRRFAAHKRINSELSEPLTTASSIVDESLGGNSADPYFVFRSDLQKKLESLDEFLADYLRIVHETVRLTYTSQYISVVILQLTTLTFVNPLLFVSSFFV